MRLFYILIILLLTGCQSTSSLVGKGITDVLKNREYTFSDNHIRYLKIKLLGDDLIEISNQVSGLQAENYYKYDFTTKYPIIKVDLWRYVIGNPIEKTHPLGGEEYVHPYRRGNFYSRADVFPNVIKDTLFFNEDFTKILLKDFWFEMSK